MNLTEPAEYVGYIMVYLSTGHLPPYRREWLGTCWLLTLPCSQALRGWHARRKSSDGN